MPEKTETGKTVTISEIENGDSKTKYSISSADPKDEHDLSENPPIPTKVRGIWPKQRFRNAILDQFIPVPHDATPTVCSVCDKNETVKDLNEQEKSNQEDHPELKSDDNKLDATKSSLVPPNEVLLQHECSNATLRSFTPQSYIFDLSVLVTSRRTTSSYIKSTINTIKSTGLAVNALNVLLQSMFRNRSEITNITVTIIRLWSIYGPRLQWKIAW